jgi:hypothetical protein
MRTLVMLLIAELKSVNELGRRYNSERPLVQLIIM